jgi:predicted NBD/HSP70 family sugar kinase
MGARSLRAILAADIGGTNVRAGIVELGSEARAPKIRDLERWRHADDEPGREEAVEGLIAMLRKLVDSAAHGAFRLAPFLGIACPRIIRPDGTIERGAQNLTGDWESEDFNLIAAALPQIGGEEMHITMHNDAVVQGLSETPVMRGVERWGILTVGTGLGNAHFTCGANAAIY